jgi:peptidoglycan/LPS O-acetylase OafA/YrhL
LQYLVPPKGLMSKWWATPFFNYSGTLSVDTFFFISGFLAAYMLMIKLDKVRHMGPSLPSYGLCPHRGIGT